MVSITGIAKQGEVLTASNTLADADGLGAITYTWKADGVAVGTGATHALSQSDVGKTITVEASYTDGQGTAESVTSAPTSAVANVNDAPTGAVSITGTAKQGEVLTASNTLSDIDGLGTITYTWKADGVAVGTGATHALSQSDVGKTITVEANYTDGQGTAESVTSEPTSAVANVNDPPTGAVTITGTARQGEVLTVSNTLADADGLGVIAYTWKSDGVAVGTGATHTLSQADVGKTITVEASYTDVQGTAESVTSAPTSAVANVNDAPTGAVTITGTAKQGEMLTAANTLADADGLGTITYTWKADGVAVGTGATHTLSQSDVGKAITVEASYVDGYGTAESVSSAATAAVVTNNVAPAAVNDVVQTFQDTVKLIAAADLLANDSDANGDALSIISADNARHGVVSLSSGQITFTPEVGYAGTASFDYTVSDGRGGVSIATVQVEVKPTKSTLAAGDIAIVALQNDNPDSFSFVTLVDLAPGTKINFTDNGWNGAAFRSGEGTYTWTSSSVVPAGTVVTFVDGTPGTIGSWATSGNLGLATSGEQIIAYQGTAAAPTLLYALNDSGAHVWQAAATNANTSGLPTGLVNGSTAVAVTQFDNVAYTGPLIGTREQLLAAIGNYTKWTGNNSLNVVGPPANFQVKSAGVLSWSSLTFNEAASYDGAVSAPILLTISGDTFTGPVGSDMVAAGLVQIGSLPAGLQARLIKTSDTTASLFLDGHALAHANIDDVSNLAFSLRDGAFAGGSATAVAGSAQTGMRVDFGDVPAALTEADFNPMAGSSYGSSDASTALALDANWMIVGDDEANVLRVYARDGGAAVVEWNYGTALGIGSNELDLEASTRIGNRLYFMGSHSNKSGGAEADNREYIFSVDVSGSGTETTFSGMKQYGGLEAALAQWDSSNGHGLGANHYGFAGSSAHGVPPETTSGFSIEGMSVSLDGQHMLLGLRAPQADTSTRNKAIVLSIDNIDAVLSGSAAPVFGAPIELDLGGRGIRSMERANDGSGYLIIAGPSGGQTASATDFLLYTWDGVATHAPVAQANALDVILDRHGGSFEAIVDVPSILPGTMIQLLQDNGDTVWAGQTVASKNLPASQQHFLGDWLQLQGAAPATDVVAPKLVSASPVDGAANVATGANVVLNFDEAVKAGSGTFQLLDGNGAVIETIAASDTARVTIAGGTVTINPDAVLAFGTTYAIRADATAITDIAGNAWVPAFGTVTPATLDFTTAPPPTVLQAGDLLFLGINADSPDAYAFVLTKDITAGTQIGFTDRNLANGQFPGSGEGAVMWTADQTYAAGTIITIQPDAAPPVTDRGSVIGTYNGGLSASGETVYAFQGSIAGLGQNAAGAITVDRMLASINVGGAAAGDIPAELVAAGTAWTFATDNAIYAGSLGHADMAAFAAAVKNPAYWNTSDTVFAPIVNNSMQFTSPLAISSIQGEGDLGSLAGQNGVLVEARVTAWMPNMKGFFVQEEARDSDGNPNTSEGVFVYYGNLASPVNAGSVGDIVRFYADVKEYNHLTELVYTTGFKVLEDGTVADLPAPVVISLPLAGESQLEALEGMLVTVVSGTSGGKLVVTDNYELGRYGSVTLTSDELQVQYTEHNAPSVSGFAAYNAQLKLDQIILDDGSSLQNPASVWGRNGQPLSAANTLRAGDHVQSVTGVLDQFVNSTAAPHQTSYRIQPTNPSNIVFTGDARPTPADFPAAVTNAEIKVASANVLNFFTTLGTGSFATPYGNNMGGRGATNAAEYQHQLDKLVDELVGLNADVYGLMEIQNNGFASDSALAALVNALNAKAGANTFAFVSGPFNDGNGAPAPTAGQDAIMVAIIYKPGSVTPLGAAAVPDVTDPAYNAFTATYGNRVPVAQTFKSNLDGEVFTVVVNHLKSKGSVNDPDIGDGQAANQVARERGAEQLLNWLATDPTGSNDRDVLLIGDFNAYSREDVIGYIDNHGFDKLATDYSYSFDGLWGSLDHAFVSDSLASQVAGAYKWHNNAEEPVILDYNMEFESPAQQLSYHAPDAYRASDHNPILIGLNLGPAAKSALLPPSMAATDEIQFAAAEEASDVSLVSLWAQPMPQPQVEPMAYVIA